jgi:ribonuclease HII
MTRISSNAARSGHPRFISSFEIRHLIHTMQPWTDRLADPGTLSGGCGRKGFAASPAWTKRDAARWPARCGSRGDRPAGAMRRAVWAAVRDSKLLTPGRGANWRRHRSRPRWPGASAGGAPRRSTAIGIAAATRQAMQAGHRCACPRAPTTAHRLGALPQRRSRSTPVQGRPHDRSVAAASILAKVHRDQLMQAYDADYPVYGFGAHKGYGVAAHLAALTAHGPCPSTAAPFAPLARCRSSSTAGMNMHRSTQAAWPQARRWRRTLRPPG